MISEIVAFFSRAPSEILIMIGWFVLAILTSLLYYIILVFAILIFFNKSFKEAFFSRDKRAGILASLFFMILVTSGLFYAFIVIGKQDNNLVAFYFSLVTSLVITIIVQETAKKLEHQAVVYDTIVGFIILLIFISPNTPTAINPLANVTWCLGTVLSLPILLILIKKINLLNKIDKILYGGNKDGEPNKSNTGK